MGILNLSGIKGKVPEKIATMASTIKKGHYRKKAFSIDEYQILRAYFEEMFDTYRYEEYGSLECNVSKDNEVLNFSWDSTSGMGWHDESYHDSTKFIVTKNGQNIPEECTNAKNHDDKRIRHIAEYSDTCVIIEHSQSEEFHFNSDKYVLITEGFLGISGQMTIVYSYACGEW